MRLNIFAIFMVFILALSPLAQEQLDTTPPAILDVGDPFSRDLNRASDHITGGVSFDSSHFSTSEHAGMGRDLLGQDIQTALTTSQFRIAGLAVRRRASYPHIHEAAYEMIELGSRPTRIYLRLGSFDHTDLARQTALNLIDAYPEYLDTALIIRMHDDGDQNTAGGHAKLDIGPFQSHDHAERFCTFLTYATTSIITECYPVEEYAHNENADSFGSLALMRLATDTIVKQVVNPELFDLPITASTMLIVKEGDKLGTGSNMITKIIPSGIFLVDNIGQISHLPFQFIPETPLPEASESINLPDLNAIDFNKIGQSDADADRKAGQSDAPNIAEQLLELE